MTDVCHFVSHFAFPFCQSQMAFVHFDSVRSSVLFEMRMIGRKGSFPFPFLRSFICPIPLFVVVVVVVVDIVEFNACSVQQYQFTIRYVYMEMYLNLYSDLALVTYSEVIEQRSKKHIQHPSLSLPLSFFCMHLSIV